MHEKPMDIQHPLLVLVLVLLNIPTYLFLGRVFFKGWRDFLSSVGSIPTFLYSQEMYSRRFGWRPPPDGEVNALYAVMKLLLFVLGALACIAAQYHFVTWLLSH